MNNSQDSSSNNLNDENTRKKSKLSLWLKRIGIAGFLFFLIKGILWLTVGAAVLRYFGCEG